MKKQIIIATVLLFSSFANSQINQDNRIFFNSISSSPLNRDVIKENAATLGTPYIYKVFLLAKVENVVGTSLMRYDACHDQFEFINTKNDTLILNKDKSFGNITFVNNNVNYLLMDYVNKDNDSVTGYMVLLHANAKYALLKKQNVILEKAREAKTSYDTDTPARFKADKDAYYLKNGDLGTVLFPLTKKGLLKMFPERKDALETFLKENSIDFSKELDLHKVVDFLAK